MNNWKVIFATVVIFGAGVITGGLLVNYVQHSHPKKAYSNPSPVAPVEVHQAATNSPAHVADNAKPRPPEVLSKQFLQQLDEKLIFTSDQRKAIQKIIGDGQSQVHKVMQDVRQDIRKVITPEQRKQFDELMKRPSNKSNAGTNTTLNLPVITNSPTTNSPATNAP